jgi:hypothetical protein
MQGIMRFSILLVLAAFLSTGCIKKPASTDSAADSSTETGQVQTSQNASEQTLSDLGGAEASNGAMAVEKVKIYTVQKGESLWNIAAKPEVYGNGYLYPLLYRANADLLTHPDKLEKGAKLIVSRGHSATEIETAKEEAMASEFHRNPRKAKAITVKPVSTVAVKPSPVATQASVPSKPAQLPKPVAKKSSGWVFWILVLLLGSCAVASIYLLKRRNKDEDQAGK